MSESVSGVLAWLLQMESSQRSLGSEPTTSTECCMRPRHGEWPRLRHAKVTLAASLSPRNRLSSVLDTQTHRNLRPRSFVVRT